MISFKSPSGIKEPAAQQVADVYPLPLCDNKMNLKENTNKNNKVPCRD